MLCMQKPGQQLCQKLCHYLQPKCHPLILDVSITSSTTVRLNIYQVYCTILLLCPQAVLPQEPDLCQICPGAEPALPGPGVGLARHGMCRQLSNEEMSHVCVTACLLQAPRDNAEGTLYMCWVFYIVYCAIYSHQMPRVVIIKTYDFQLLTSSNTDQQLTCTLDYRLSCWQL